MKKAILSLVIVFATTVASMAQTFPYGINYQAVARDPNGNPKNGQQVPVQFTIYQSSSTGTKIWQEQQVCTTNAMGQFNAIIGHGAPITPFNTTSFSQIYWGSDSTFLKVEINSNISFTGTFSQIGNTTKFQAVPYALSTNLKAPTVTRLSTIGTGTYTTPANVLYVKVRVVGGGGGGAGGGSGVGGSGAQSSFGTALITANGGVGGSGQSGGTGGSAASTSGIILLTVSGGSGSAGDYNAGNTLDHAIGGMGGSSFFGGSGGGGGSGGATGYSAALNSGSGGGGGAGTWNSGSNGGGGGGAGGYAEIQINSPNATYPFVVGSGGNGGTGGVSGGGAGAAGIIIIEEYYK